MSRKRSAPRSWAALVVVTGLLASAGTWLSASATETGAQTPEEPFTVEVDPDPPADLADGQPITVDVTMREGLTMTLASVHICRPGTTYEQNFDVLRDAGKCPGEIPLSASSPTGSSVPLTRFASDTRARGTIFAGVGTAEWTHSFDGSRFQLTCGPSDPCLLVTRVEVAGVGTNFDTSVTLTYRAGDQVPGCTGGDPNGPATAGADRMIDAWREWTAGQCRSGSGTATTRAPVAGEGDAVTSFASGGVDLAYSASGYGPPDFDPAEPRAMVPVPVAVNAVVLAASGGHYPRDDPEWPNGLVKPYGEIVLTADEVATMLGEGQALLEEREGPEILARNPELNHVVSHIAAGSGQPMALSSASAISYYMTSYLDQLAPEAWRSSPPLGSEPRGVYSNLAAAEPPFSAGPVLQLVLDSSQFDRAVYQAQQNFFDTPDRGPRWFLTDLATATRLNLTPVSLPNADGVPVRPTAESLTAALPTMGEREDGTLAPDITATAQGAYPLTMVEYALVPAAPLVDAQCQPRAATQELMVGWLEYITSDAGQALLPEGYQPLTPELREAAAAALPQVGAGTVVCVAPGTTEPPPSTTQPTTAPGTTAPLAPQALGPLGPASVTNPSQFGATGSGAAGAGPVAPAAARTPTANDRRDAAEAAEDSEIETPPFLGIRALNEILTPLAILLIVALTSVAAFGTSGRPAPPALAAVGRSVGRAAGAVGRRALLGRGN